MSKAQLLEQIEQLPREERAELILAATESLEQPSPQESDKLWAEEIDRHIAGFKSGKTKGILYEEVMRDVESRLE